jgi:hypothetical protein
MGYVKRNVFIPPLPANQDDLKQRITQLLQVLIEICYYVVGNN